MAVNIVVASSNIFGAPLLWTLDWYYGAVAMTLSTLMHLTETKHSLNPLILMEYSHIFLNMDRLMTYIIAPIYINRLWRYPGRIRLALFGIAGMIALRIGEIRTSNIIFNCYIYPTLHCFWHFTVYTIMFMLAREK